MKKVLLLLLCCVALAMTVSAAPAEPDAEGIYNVKTAEGFSLAVLTADDAEVSKTGATVNGVEYPDFYPEGVKLRLTYDGASNGIFYLLIVQKGTGDPTEENIVYIDQKTGSSGGVSFTIYPKSWETGDYSIRLSDSDGNVLVPVTYSCFAADVLQQDEDGIWRCYRGGVFRDGYTGLVKNGSGTFYVREGVLASDVSGLETIDGEVCEIENGQLATWHSELILYNDEWLYLNQGKLDLHYTGLAENPNGWWYVTDGHMNFDFIGLQTNENGTWYVYKGQLVTWRDESVEEIDGNLYYCYKGQLCEWFTGLVPCGSDWIYVTKGVWDRSYTGLTENANGWWYVFNGLLDLSYTGLAANENGTFYVYKGQLVTWHGEEVFCDWVDGEYHMFYKGQLTTWDTYPKLVYPGGEIEEWVPMIGGSLAPDFTGIAVNENGYWYVFEGHMDFDFTGLTTNADGTWYVYKGQLVTWKDGIQYIESEGKNYYVYQGQMAEWHTGDIEEGGVVYHVTDGVVTSWD